MKKIYVINKIIISIILISLIMTPKCVQANTIGSVIRDGDSFVSATTGSPVNGDRLAGVSSSIYNIFLGIAIAVAVSLAAYLGVQYITSSAMDKAKVKESFLALVLGCIVAFGAFGIWKVLVMMLGKIS